EADHLPRGIGSRSVGKRSVFAAAGPGVTSTSDEPILQTCICAVLESGLDVGSTAAEAAPCLALNAADETPDNPFGIGRMHGLVGVAMEDNRIHVWRGGLTASAHKVVVTAHRCECRHNVGGGTVGQARVNADPE